MIRHQQGSDYLLFTQDDHARLSGALAEQIGNGWFAAPQPRKPVIDAIAMHDRGWTLHDDAPTLNAAGLPLHVFETPIDIAARVWSESVRLAREVDLYSGLLVSLHTFALSAMSYKHYTDPKERQDHAKELFQTNKFQQNQIEFQEQVREHMGMRKDMPLVLGLAPRGSGAKEDLLRYHYQLLRAMDQLSLALLCSEQPIKTIEEIQPRQGADPVDLHISYRGAFTIAVSPWPFGAETITVSVPHRRIAAKKFTDVEEFRETYSAASVGQTPVRLVKGT